MSKDLYDEPTSVSKVERQQTRHRWGSRRGVARGRKSRKGSGTGLGTLAAEAKERPSVNLSEGLAAVALPRLLVQG